MFIDIAELTALIQLIYLRKGIETAKDHERSNENEWDRINERTTKPKEQHKMMASLTIWSIDDKVDVCHEMFR